MILKLITNIISLVSINMTITLNIPDFPDSGSKFSGNYFPEFFEDWTNF